jgi:hypothetical protein
MIGLFFPGIDRHHQQPNTQAHTLGIVVAIDKRELFMRQQRERYIANLAHAKDRLSHERRLADHFRQPAAANNHELEDRFLVMRTLTRNGGVVREDDGFKPTHVLHGLALKRNILSGQTRKLPHGEYHVKSCRIASNKNTKKQAWKRL